MDISETYIKMCEKLEEIQGLSPDIVENENCEGLTLQHYPENIMLSFTGDFFADNGDKPIIWLPRQDQLQEMIEGTTFEVLDKFFGWREFDAPVKLVKKASMEQLWLAFVMKEIYNKVWNGESWVKSGK